MQDLNFVIRNPQGFISIGIMKRMRKEETTVESNKKNRPLQERNSNVETGIPVLSSKSKQLATPKAKSRIANSPNRADGKSPNVNSSSRNGSLIPRLSSPRVDSSPAVAKSDTKHMCSPRQTRTSLLRTQQQSPVKSPKAGSPKPSSKSIPKLGKSPAPSAVEAMSTAQFLQMDIVMSPKTGRVKMRHQDHHENVSHVQFPSPEKDTVDNDNSDKPKVKNLAVNFEKIRSNAKRGGGGSGYGRGLHHARLQRGGGAIARGKPVAKERMLTPKRDVDLSSLSELSPNLEVDISPGIQAGEESPFNDVKENSNEETVGQEYNQEKNIENDEPISGVNKNISNEGLSSKFNTSVDNLDVDIKSLTKIFSGNTRSNEPRKSEPFLKKPSNVHSWQQRGSKTPNRSAVVRENLIKERFKSIESIATPSQVLKTRRTTFRERGRAKHTPEMLNFDEVKSPSEACHQDPEPGELSVNIKNLRGLFESKSKVQVNLGSDRDLAGKSLDVTRDEVKSPFVTTPKIFVTEAHEDKEAVESEKSKNGCGSQFDTGNKKAKHVENKNEDSESKPSEKTQPIKPRVLEKQKMFDFPLNDTASSEFEMNNSTSSNQSRITPRLAEKLSRISHKLRMFEEDTPKSSPAKKTDESVFDDTKPLLNKKLYAEQGSIKKYEAEQEIDTDISQSKVDTLTPIVRAPRSGKMNKHKFSSVDVDPVEETEESPGKKQCRGLYESTPIVSGNREFKFSTTLDNLSVDSCNSASATLGNELEGNITESAINRLVQVYESENSRDGKSRTESEADTVLLEGRKDRGDNRNVGDMVESGNSKGERSVNESQIEGQDEEKLNVKEPRISNEDLADKKAGLSDEVECMEEDDHDDKLQNTKKSQIVKNEASDDQDHVSRDEITQIKPSKELSNDKHGDKGDVTGTEAKICEKDESFSWLEHLYSSTVSYLGSRDDSIHTLYTECVERMREGAGGARSTSLSLDDLVMCNSQVEQGVEKRGNVEQKGAPMEKNRYNYAMGEGVLVLYYFKYLFLLTYM